MLMVIIILILSLVLFMLAFLSFQSAPSKEKLYSFECGFNPFFAPRKLFSIQFFKILLIFLVFDMEIIVILPLLLSGLKIKLSLLFFVCLMLILIFGLFYEWREGSLEWLF